jgi:uncharacterized protein (TIGR02996 family)
MIDEAALLAAIRAAPDDDAPRLVYADWLSERGDPRGEYITLSCTFAKSYDMEARRRADELEAAHREAWVAHLPPWTRAEAKFWRGFVSRVTVSDLTALFAHAAEILALTPVPRVDLASGGEAVISPDTTRVLVKTIEKESWDGGFQGNTSFAEGKDLYAVRDLATWRELLRHEISWWWNDSGHDTMSDRPSVEWRADGRALVLKSNDGTIRELPIP